MRNTPHIPVGVVDPKVNRFMTGVQACLQAVLDLNVYEATLAWKAPYELFIPLQAGMIRNTPPKIVELGRASIVNEPDTPVHFGATTWKWVSYDRVLVLDQAGLVEGIKYNLVYKVIG